VQGAFVVQIISSLADALGSAAFYRALPPPRERRERRVAAGLSQRQLAKALGVSHTTVGRWEREGRTPRVGHAGDYVAALEALKDSENTHGLAGRQPGRATTVQQHRHASP
jgi:DNA-binding XRE family transcriptional regulator